MARPSKFNDQLKETILDLYRRGRTDEQVAAIIGVCVKTLHNWKGKHPSFLHALRDSKFVADGLVEASLFGKATGYSHEEEKVFIVDGKVKRVLTRKQYAPDTTAAIFWLKNRQPEKWRENYELDIHSMDNKSDEELDARIKALMDQRDKGKK